MEQAIHAKLSELQTNPVFLVKAPQDQARPYVVFHRTETEPVRSNDGVNGLVRIKLQVNCYADTYYAAKGLASLVRAFDGFKGQVEDQYIQAAFLETETDQFIEPSDSDQAGIHSVSQDFSVWICGALDYIP